MIGKKIKKLIDNSEMSQSKLALELGISRPTLQRLFERDSIETQILQTLCKIFNVELSYFFEELEGVEIPEGKKELEEPKNDYWKTKYLETMEKLSNLQDDLLKSKDQIIELQGNELSNYRGSNMSLGKDKANIEKATPCKTVRIFA